MMHSAPASSEQQALLLAVLGEGDVAPLLQWVATGSAAKERLWRRGLQAYRANGQALAERALTAAYPVVTQLMGEENFARLSRHFWTRQPPLCGDMACWGGTLAAFVEAAPQLAGDPYLADVARLEWLLHEAGSAADADADPSSFSLLTSCDPQDITLTLGAGTALLESPYPVASIVNAHLLGRPSLQEAGQRLNAGTAEQAVVWRQGFAPHTRDVSPAEYLLLSRLLAGQSLSSALEALDPSFDFSAWLGTAVQSGLVSGARYLATTGGKT